MSTFEENIANLRQNNRLVTQQIKTYNLDEAKFESARLQKQGELWLLAGELGANLIEKIAANREKDAINEEYISYYENQWEEYLKSDEAAAAEKLFKSNANNQNDISNEIVKLENAGAPSDDVAEAKLSTGKHIRLREQLKTANIAQRYSAWLQSELLNNTDIFFAEIEGKSVKIQVNNPNLTFKEKIAAQKYLTKEYLKLHDIQKYSRDFLYLPTERGGSGFMKTILEANQTNTEALRNAYKIELSEVDINLATRNLATLKDSQSFKDLLSTLTSGYDTKGKPLNYAGAWKRLNDKILPQMLDAGLLSPDKILELGNTTTINFQGKEILLKDLRPAEWGEDGKWHLKAMEVWKNKGERAQAKADFKLEEAAEKFIENFTNGTFTSELDVQRARAVLEALNKEGTGDYDFSKIDALVDTNLTQDQADNRARQLLEDFNTNKTGWRLDEILKSEDILVRENPILTKAIAEDKRIWNIVEGGIGQMKQNYFYLEQTGEGKDVWVIKSSNHYRKWKALEGYAVRYFKQNQNKGINVADVWDATKTWEKSLGGEEEIGTPYAQWEAKELKLEALAATGDTKAIEQLAEHKRKKNLLFVQDSEGRYPNLTPLMPNIGESKEDKKELEALQLKKKNAEAKFTNPKTIIPEEQAIFQNREIDYNKMLDDIGYIPDTLVDLAAAEGLTTAEFIKYRQTANGKGDLKPEYAKFLNEKEVSTLPSAMKKRLLGQINDGLYTSEHIAATVTENSNVSSFSIINTWGEHGEQWIQGLGTNYETFAASLDDDGEWINNSESGKALIGFYSSIAMSLDPNIFNDFQPNGQNLFIETVKTNLSDEAIASMVMSPDFGFNAYAASGDIDYLPVVDSLQATKGQDNLNKIRQKLAKMWQTETPEDETTTSEPVITDQDLTISGSDIIDESLNTDN